MKIKEIARHPDAVFGDGRCMAERLSGRRSPDCGPRDRCSHLCSPEQRLCGIHHSALGSIRRNVGEYRIQKTVGWWLIRHLLRENADKILLVEQAISRYKKEIGEWEDGSAKDLARLGWDEEDIAWILSRK